MSVYLGIDFGTSGARAIAIAAEGKIQAQAITRYADPTQQTTTVWQQALFTLLDQLPLEVRAETQAIAINGTSSTVLLCDTAGNPITDPLLYNDGRGRTVLAELQAIAPPNHTVLSATSSLAKLLWWQRSHPNFSAARYFLHQADWLAFLLHGQLGISDYHNSLKLGYDVGELRYPDWLTQLAIAPLLPQVVAPGTKIGAVTSQIATRFGFPTTCQVCAGTTDSIAAFLASGAHIPGAAVTSLGSTLVLKLLSSTRVDHAEFGVYSHRLGDLWLVGGASNTGGAVLQRFFTPAELDHLSQQIDPTHASPLDYYPLLQPGERFPINDPTLQPRLSPQPDRPVEFLHGLLESIARIEAQAYRLLQNLGATPLTQVYTAGGGAANPTWSGIRARHLQVPMVQAHHTEAAYGTAQLASGLTSTA